MPENHDDDKWNDFFTILYDGTIDEFKGFVEGLSAAELRRFMSSTITVDKKKLPPIAYVLYKNDIKIDFLKKYKYLLMIASEEDLLWTDDEGATIFKYLTGLLGIVETIHACTSVSPFHNIICGHSNDNLKSHKLLMAAEVCLMNYFKNNSGKITIESQGVKNFFITMLHDSFRLGSPELFEIVQNALILGKNNKEENALSFVKEILSYGLNYKFYETANEQDIAFKRFRRGIKIIQSQQITGRNSEAIELIEKALDGYAVATNIDLLDPQSMQFLVMLCCLGRFDSIDNLIEMNDNLGADYHEVLHEMLTLSFMDSEGKVIDYYGMLKATLHFGLQKNFEDFLIKYVKDDVSNLVYQDLTTELIAKHLLILDFVVQYPTNKEQPTIEELLNTIISKFNFLSQDENITDDKSELIKKYVQALVRKKLILNTFVTFDAAQLEIIFTKITAFQNELSKAFKETRVGLLKSLLDFEKLKDEQFEDMLKLMIKDNLSDFESVLASQNLNSLQKEKLTTFIEQNFGWLSTLINTELLITALELKDKPSIEYKHLIGYVSINKKTALTLIKELQIKKILHSPPEIITPIDNPIVLASKNHDLETLKYIFENRETEPWASYWLQAGDPDNSLLTYLLSVNEKGVVTDMFKYAINIFNVVQYINHDFLRTENKPFSGETRRYKQSLLNKKIYKDNFFQRRWRKSIKSIWDEFLSLQKLQSKADGSLITRENESNAHREDIERKGFKICDENYTALVNDRYPNKDLKEQDQLLLHDARLLIIKLYIENEPLDKGSKQYALWKEFITLAKAEDYYTTFKKMGNLSFQDFKEFASSHELVMNAVKQDKSSVLLDILNNPDIGNNTYYSWLGFNLARSRLYGNNRLKQFIYFNVVLMAEDLNKILEKINDPNDLYPMLRVSMSGKAKAIRKQIYDGDVADIKELKNSVKECLLEDQQLMASILTYNFVEGAGYCDVGFVTRFTSRIIAIHHKFGSTPDRTLKVREYLDDRFGKATEKILVNILINRLKEQSMIPAAKKNLFMIFTDKGPSEFKPELKAHEQLLLDLFNQPPTNLPTLQAKVDAMPAELKQFVISKMFSDREQFNLTEDPELSKVFDALFSINSENFYKIFIGDCRIKNYSKLKVDDQSSIHQSEFDGRYGRRKLLQNIFHPKTLQAEILSNLRENDPKAKRLSKKERRFARFYVIAGASAKVSNETAEKLIDKLTALSNGPCDQFICRLKALKNKWPEKSTMQKSLDERSLTESLVEVICKELFKTQDKKEDGQEFFVNNIEDEINSSLGLTEDHDLRSILRQACKNILNDDKSHFEMRLSVCEFLQQVIGNYILDDDSKKYLSMIVDKLEPKQSIVENTGYTPNIL